MKTTNFIFRSPAPSSTDVRRDDGFAVIEIIIAAFVLLAVIGGVGLAVTSSSQLQSSAKLRSHASAQVDRIFDFLDSNAGWTSKCGNKTGKCTVYSDKSGVIDISDVVKDKDLGFDWKVSIVATAIDSPDDGLSSGPNGDRDGVVPDYWKVDVIIDLPKSEAALFPGFKPLEISKLLDAKGQQATGTLVVEVCKAVNQADERIPVDGCSSTIRWIQLPPCDRTGTCPSWAAALGKAPSVNDASTFMGVQRGSASFTLLQLDNDGKPITGAPTLSSASAKTSASNPGIYTFSEIPAGSYEIKVTSTSGGLAWDSHMRPANKKIVVQPRSRSTALVSLKPPGAGKVTFDLYRNVSYLYWSKQQVTDTFSDSGCGSPSTFPGTVPLGVLSGEPWYNGSGEYRFCRDLKRYATMYYFAPQIKGPFEWGGSGVDVGFSTKPDPTGRLLDSKVIAGKVSYSEKFASTAASSKRGQPSQSHKTSISNIEPGLWKPIKIDNSAATTSSSFVGSPLWISPSGSINGTTSPTIKISTPGECYVSLPSSSVEKTSYSSSSYSSSDGTISQPGYTDKMSSSCALSTFIWNKKTYVNPGAKTWAYRFCGRTAGTYWTQKLVDINEYTTTTDPVTGEETTTTTVIGQKWKTTSSNPYDTTRCNGFDPPLPCTDNPARNCGTAILYIPGDGKRVPDYPSKMTGVKFGV